ncbi:cilia- and flagella-associated protein 276 isoform X2 [Takifugu rubripes]|uniref:cilia- and flagella-associated protein 276 isoform X2 n=1 Tax=Takifugu rubripes TaxID=31033 RepID=UPI0005D2C027|nr:uncharacterized protein C1orf194 homolog isoform X2 [Takifugu rubripes]XP_056895602.1 cilia- and flagella-associated protein 276 isoform X2 [Takifugu flavidus]|eukprot:XP_011620235.1 PREDICTED: uncharacterized protein C1orf194 homolog isoform X3 [Takifugu rubripes]
MSKRDPFPSPKPENDAHFSGFRPPQRKSYDKPTHIAQMEEPWSHLHSSSTLASTRRSAGHKHRNSGDSLDFQLQSVYDHSKDFFWTKNQMLYQKETVSELPGKQEKEEEKDIRMWVDPQRGSVYSIK